MTTAALQEPKKVDIKVRNTIPLTTLLQEIIKDGKSITELARKYKVSYVAIWKRIQHIYNLLDQDKNEVYTQNRINFLTGVERQLLTELLNPDKLKKATTGNIAYAFTQIFNANRLERGESTGRIDYINIQQAEGQAIKSLQKLLHKVGVNSPESITNPGDIVIDLPLLDNSEVSTPTP